MLAHMLTTLNARHGYGLDLFLLSIDEGIAGYRRAQPAWHQHVDPCCLI